MLALGVDILSVVPDLLSVVEDYRMCDPGIPGRTFFEGLDPVTTALVANTAQCPSPRRSDPRYRNSAKEKTENDLEGNEKAGDPARLEVPKTKSCFGSHAKVESIPEADPFSTWPGDAVTRSHP